MTFKIIRCSLGNPFSTFTNLLVLALLFPLICSRYWHYTTDWLGCILTNGYDLATFTDSEHYFRQLIGFSEWFLHH